MEQSRGLATHNIMTVVMQEFQLDHVSVMDWLEAHIKEDVDRFLVNYARLPSWGEDIDRRLKMYVDGLGYWIRGNDCWSSEGQDILERRASKSRNLVGLRSDRPRKGS